MPGLTRRLHLWTETNISYLRLKILALRSKIKVSHILIKRKQVLKCTLIKNNYDSDVDN
jgi:hypothetical protein